jgi:hypothetical protein
MLPSYETYEALLSKGEHLEHLHAYFSSPFHNSTREESSHKNTAVDTKLRKPPDESATIDFHTDGGLFIAMTAGLYKTHAASLDSGLYIRLPSGSTAMARLDDDSLVIMIGEGGARWLQPRLPTEMPLRAVPHALKVAFPKMLAGDSVGTRAW